MPNKPTAITAEEYATWITPRDTLASLAHMGRRTAILAVFERLQHGYIKAAVRRLRFQGHDGEYMPIDAAIWKNASYGIATSSFWVSGDITIDIPVETALSHTHRPLALFGVRFDSAGIQELNPAKPAPQRPAQQPASTLPVPPTMVERRGRPRKEWWDDLWIEMARRLYRGELKYDRQADIEKAMADWLDEQDHEAGEATIRRAAQKLFRMLVAEDQK